MGRYNVGDLQHNSYLAAEPTEKTGIESGAKSVGKKALLKPSAKGDIKAKRPIEK